MNYHQNFYPLLFSPLTVIIAKKGVFLLSIRCLVLDHDDTVVRSAETVNYPALLDALALMRPGMTITYADFMRDCFFKNFSGMCKDRFGFSDEEVDAEFELWKVYVRTHTPPPYDGMAELLQRFRSAGGIVCVSSHSGVENISRDYQTHFGFLPDRIFGWELREKRKPHPFALQEIMREFSLRPQELLMVDDMKAGLEMANACGVPFACAGWSHEDPEVSSVMRKAYGLYFESVDRFADFLFSEENDLTNVV